MNQTVDLRTELEQLKEPQLDKLAEQLKIFGSSGKKTEDLIQFIAENFDPAGVRSLLKSAEPGKKLRSKYLLRWLIPWLVPAVVAAVVGLPPAINSVRQIFRLEKPPDLATEFLVRNTFSSSLIIVPRLAHFSVPNDTSILVFWKNPSGIYELQKRSEIQDKKYFIYGGLKPGLYKVELTFYGVRQKIAENLSIGQNTGQIVELSSANSVGTLQFLVVSKDERPLKGAYVELYTNENTPVANRASETDANGKTAPLWVGSVLYKGDYYYAKVFYPGKGGQEVGRSDKISVVFRSTDQNELRVIQTNAKSTDIVVTITSPKSGDVVPRKYTVRGDLKNLGSNYILVFVYALGARKWFFQEVAKISSGGKWQAEVTIGALKDVGYNFQIVATVIAHLPQELTEIASDRFPPQGTLYQSQIISVKRR